MLSGCRGYWLVSIGDINKTWGATLISYYMDIGGYSFRRNNVEGRDS